MGAVHTVKIIPMEMTVLMLRKKLETVPCMNDPAGLELLVETMHNNSRTCFEFCIHTLHKHAYMKLSANNKCFSFHCFIP